MAHVPGSARSRRVHRSSRWSLAIPELIPRPWNAASRPLLWAQALSKPQEGEINPVFSVSVP